jgi:hypothetical protein
MGRLITTTVESESRVYKEIWKRMGLLMTAIEFPLLRTAVEMVKPGVVECFLVDAEAPSHSGGSTSFVSLSSLCLIDNQKQNQHASLVKYCCTPF